MGLDRGRLGVALVAVLGTLGCGGASPVRTDGGRDTPTSTPSDTAESPVDTASGTPVDVGGETADVAADSSDNQASDALATGSDASDMCAPDQNQTRFVDHALGTDDHAHGRGPGSCAFRTLAYALDQAPGQISLSAQDTYQGGIAGETFPFQLTGNQSLACNGATLVTDLDDISDGDNGTVNLAGTRNSVTGCHFDGAEGGKDCIVVKTSAGDLTRSQDPPSPSAATS